VVDQGKEVVGLIVVQAALSKDREEVELIVVVAEIIRDLTG
jgi:hypothetical protein